MGLKLLLVCALALLMSIPALFVFALLMDRTNRAEKVTTELSTLVGGPQTFMGPVLAIPYSRVIPANGEAKATTETGTYIVFPKTGAATANLTTGVKQRGLFKAVTWTSQLSMKSSFDLATAGSAAPNGANLDWAKAEILVGASDARGAHTNIDLVTGASTIQMTPASSLSSIELNAGETLVAMPKGVTPRSL
jgi:inner membrane protein